MMQQLSPRLTRWEAVVLLKDVPAMKRYETIERLRSAGLIGDEN